MDTKLDDVAEKTAAILAKLEIIGDQIKANGKGART
jgi:hypothetical protein